MGDKEINILSLGAGIQSSTMLLMMCGDELPMPDHIIFADTQWEPAEVYENLEFLETQARRAGLEITRVTAGNIKKDALRSQVRGKAEDGNRWASMPYYVRSGVDRKGQIRRQCTAEYKIAPIDNWIKRDLLGLKPYARMPKGVQIRSWRGISSDEMSRVRAANGATHKVVYPLAGFIAGTAHPTSKTIFRLVDDGTGACAWNGSHRHSQADRSRARPASGARFIQTTNGDGSKSTTRRSLRRRWSLTKRFGNVVACAATFFCTLRSSRSTKCILTPTSIRARRFSAGSMSARGCVEYERRAGRWVITQG